MKWKPVPLADGFQPIDFIGKKKVHKVLQLTWFDIDFVGKIRNNGRQSGSQQAVFGWIARSDKQDLSPASWNNRLTTTSVYFTLSKLKFVTFLLKDEEYYLQTLGCKILPFLSYWMNFINYKNVFSKTILLENSILRNFDSSQIKIFRATQ